MTEHELNEESHDREARAIEHARARMRAKIVPACREPGERRAGRDRDDRRRDGFGCIVAGHRTCLEECAQCVEHRVGLLGHHRVACALQRDHAHTRQRVQQRSRALDRRHQIARAEDGKYRTAHGRRVDEAMAVGLASLEVGVKNAGQVRSIRRSALPFIHIPGTVLPPSCLALEIDQPTINSYARWASSRAAASNSSLTSIGAAGPSSAILATRSGWRAAHASTASDPSECPTSADCATPAASSNGGIQSAIASTVACAVPADRPCPGRSTASTLNP